MKKRPFVPVEGVSNIELFYDLIFVYCISVLTSLCHHIEGDFLDIHTWAVYMFSFFVVLQVWFFTTLLMNRYGDRSASDNICLFINMFLLYFLASGIQNDWQDSFFTFNFAWALIIVNLLVHWVIKRFRYDNLDETELHIINRTILVLAIQLAIVLVAAFLPATMGVVASWIGLLFGTFVWMQLRAYRKKPSRFSHISERCSLLVIVAFGETIVTVSIYLREGTPIWYPIFIFALVVGLFLIYMYEHDNMTDHQRKTDGMAYMTVTGWVILIIGNLTVALEYMPDSDIALLPKSIFLLVCLVLYLLTSFVLGCFNKAEFRCSVPYIIGRIGVCVFIVAVAFITNFDTWINLVCDTAAVYFALWHEWLLYHGRTRLVSFGHSLGYTEEGAENEGLSFKTVKGRRAIMRAYRAMRNRGTSDKAGDAVEREDTPSDTEGRDGQ